MLKSILRFFFGPSLADMRKAKMLSRAATLLDGAKNNDMCQHEKQEAAVVSLLLHREARRLSGKNAAMIYCEDEDVINTKTEADEHAQVEYAQPV